MKKKTLGFLAAVLSMCMLAGCGAKDTGDGTDAATGAGAESTALKDMDVDKYVTLGEYKGLEVSVDTVEVDEDEWDSLVNNVYYENITAENGGIMDRAVETGDTVNIDYEGKKDGVAFDGGTAQGYDLTIGSGSFIAGFEDGLIGVMPGETVDLNLTFPENYGKSDLAGQAVVFTVTVNYIQPAQDGEFSDEVISNFGIDGVTNEEELRQYAYDYLNENAQQNYETNVQQAVMDAFMANNTFTSVPVPMRPVDCAWIPPQNSQLGPKRTTRTLSPYFSPKRAIAPSFLASSNGVSRCSSSGRSGALSVGKKWRTWRWPS